MVALKTSNWINLFGVLGTWLIAVFAVWGEQIRSLLIQPKLRVELADPRGELTSQFVGWQLESGNVLSETPTLSGTTLSGTMTQKTRAARYYHIRLSNQGRARFPAAHQAQVMITRLELLGPDAQPQGIWQQPLPLRWRYQEADPTTARTIGAAVEADLFYVDEDSSLQLTPMIQPSNFPGHYKGPTRLWVTVQARSLEADSKPIRVQIAWDGQWEPGETEMAKHLVVSTT